MSIAQSMGMSGHQAQSVTVFRGGGGGAGLDPRSAASALPNGSAGDVGASSGKTGPYGRPMAFLDEPDPAMPWAGRLSSRYMGTLTHMLGERAPGLCPGPLSTVRSLRLRPLDLPTPPVHGGPN